MSQICRNPQTPFILEPFSDILLTKNNYLLKYMFLLLFEALLRKNIGTMEMRKTLLLLTGQLAFILNSTFLLNIIIGVIYVGNHLSEF